MKTEIMSQCEIRSKFIHGSQPTNGLSIGSPMEELEKELKELKVFATP